MSGSGPTVVALFAAAADSERAAEAMADREPPPIRARSVGEAFALAREAGDP